MDPQELQRQKTPNRKLTGFGEKEDAFGLRVGHLRGQGDLLIPQSIGPTQWMTGRAWRREKEPGGLFRGRS